MHGRVVTSITHRAWISRVAPQCDVVARAVASGLDALGFTVSSGERWAVKLNLTYPEYLPGVVNAPAFVEGLCRWARDSRVEMVFVEGDGGNGAYSAQDAFDGNGVTQLAARYGMRCVSISEKPWEWRETPVGGLTVRLPYSPFFGRRDYDRFITTPLFKNHIFTIVTLGLKNLWGCIPDSYRMYYHHILDAGIVALAKELRPDASIFDGLVAMRGRGPIEGDPLVMNSIMLASSVGAGELAALEVMGVPLARVGHLQLARAEGLLPVTAELQWLRDPAPFLRQDFIVERTWLNHLSIWLGKSPGLQRLIYHSSLSPAIYRAVNRLRGNSAQTKLYHARYEGRYTHLPIRRP